MIIKNIRIFFIVLISLCPLLVQAAENSTADDFAYEQYPVFLNVKVGYRYPTGNVSTFDDGVNYGRTKANQIYKPGLGLGLNIGYIQYPIIFGFGMEGGYLPLTSRGQALANQRHPEWSSVDVEYACFELFFGAYLYRANFFSIYSCISIGDVSVNFSTDGKNPDNKDYLGSAFSFGVELRPFDFKLIYFIINGRYQFYISKPVIPKDIIVFFGVGVSAMYK